MPRIVMMKDLENKIREKLKDTKKSFPLYGRTYGQENLVQIWDIKKRCDLKEVGKVISSKKDIHLLFGKEKVLLSKISVIPYQTDFISRAKGIIDTNLLSGKKVAFVGLGSVGSNLALYLAQSSVGGYRLIDNDIIEASNISRHASDLSYLGRYKTRAVKDLILLRNPKAQVETFEEDFLELCFEEQIRKFEGVDLVIASTDSISCQFMVNEICLFLKIPSLYIGCYERAQAGEVVFVIPGKTSCFNCLMEFRAKAMSKMMRKERLIPYSNEDINEEKAGLQEEPGLGVDILYPVIVSAAFSLALLTPSSSRGSILDLEKNLILLHSGNKPKGEYAKMFNMPFDYILAKSTRKKRCEFCRDINS